MIDQLSQSPQQFDFFQAVRLLERHYRSRSQADGNKRRSAIGRDATPQQETVRFKVLPSLNFPGSDIHSVTIPPASDEDGGHESPPEMTVTFMGLTGPHGVLPEHYTALVMARLRQKDTALLDFLDLFHHRSISLFYRAWEKCRFPYLYESQRWDSDSEDLFTQSLYSLVGLGTAGLRGRVDFDDAVLIFYAGAFSHHPRTAAMLEQLLSEQFEIPVCVEQFQGQWLYLDESSRSRLPSTDRPRGQHNQLGTDIVLGERVRDVQGRFRLRIGPLQYDEFHRFMPSGDGLRRLCQLTRTYVGIEYDFDVQVVLQSSQVPSCQLSDGEPEGPRLGWNTWLRSTQSEQDAEDAIFLLSDV